MELEHAVGGDERAEREEQERVAEIERIRSPQHELMRERYRRRDARDRAQREADGQHGDGDDGTGDRTGGSDVEQRATIEHRGAKSDERAHGAEHVELRRERQEERRRAVDTVPAREHVMARFVREQDRREWQREGESGEQQTTRRKVRDFGNQPTEARARDGHREQREREQQSVQPPSHARSLGLLYEHQPVVTIPTIPVVRAIPVGECGSECR